jgi:hypothetical protein
MGNTIAERTDAGAHHRAEQGGYSQRIAVAGGTALAVIDLAQPSLTGQAPPAGLVVSWPPRLVNQHRSKFPVLPAFPSPDGRTLLGFCYWCQVWHVHGRHGHPDDCRRRLKGQDCTCGLHPDYHASRGPCTCPPGSGDGHRTAHCYTLSQSPLKATGYVVREMRTS